MKRTVKIGVIPLYDRERDSLWMLPGYFDSILHAGGLPVMLPLTQDSQRLKEMVDCVDGVLFPGGQDIQPERYGQPIAENCGEICWRRDAMEWELLKLCRVRRKPVYGICRGIQLFNAALGGTLHQHLPDTLVSETDHHMIPPYDRVTHMVSVETDSLLYRIIGKTQMWVNSYHHQGICRLSPVLSSCAWSSDGLIEAVEDRSQPFFLATQWHPEFLWKTDTDSQKIFSAFVQACRTNGKSLGFYAETDYDIL